MKTIMVVDPTACNSPCWLCALSCYGDVLSSSGCDTNRHSNRTTRYTAQRTHRSKLPGLSRAGRSDSCAARLPPRACAGPRRPRPPPGSWPPRAARARWLGPTRRPRAADRWSAPARLSMRALSSARVRASPLRQRIEAHARTLQTYTHTDIQTRTRMYRYTRTFDTDTHTHTYSHAALCIGTYMLVRIRWAGRR